MLTVIVSYAFFYKAQLGHDGTQSTVVGCLLQVAVGYDFGSYLRQGKEYDTGIIYFGW